MREKRASLLLLTNMGRDKRDCERGGATGAPSARLSGFEERVGELLVAVRLGVVGPDPFDLGFEQRYALQQLVLGVAVERLLGELARRISADPGEIVLHAMQDDSGAACCQRGPTLGLWTVAFETLGT